jgi:hypothetical protein
MNVQLAPAPIRDPADACWYLVVQQICRTSSGLPVERGGNFNGPGQSQHAGFHAERECCTCLQEVLISVFHFDFFFTVDAEASIGWYDDSVPSFYFLLDSHAGTSNGAHMLDENAVQFCKKS